MDSSVLSFGKNVYDRLRESVFSSNYRSPYTLVDDGNDDDDEDEESVQSPSNMFFSVQAPNPESIPMTDSRAFYDERITIGENTSELFDSDYRANQYSDGDLGYSDFSYTRMSEFQSDAEEQPVSTLIEAVPGTRWLSLTGTMIAHQKQPSAIYLDVPPPVNSTNSQKRTLAESLLPTTSAVCCYQL